VLKVVMMKTHVPSSCIHQQAQPSAGDQQIIGSSVLNSMEYLSPRKRGNMFSPALVCLCVCLSVCLSVFDHYN